MILSDRDLVALYPVLFPDALPGDVELLINPASVDVRVGASAVIERRRVDGAGLWLDLSLGDYTEEAPLLVEPGEFVLAATRERLRVPNGYAVELRLKSSRAREGWDHSLAFWFDPGWDGVGTMELRNSTRYHVLGLWSGLRIGQVIVHRLTSHAVRPYAGRYQGASSVERSKA